MKRTITASEYETVLEGIELLAQILEAVGIVKLNVDAEEKTIFWDTKNKGQVNPELLSKFFSLVEKFYHDEEIYLDEGLKESLK